MISGEDRVKGTPNIKSEKADLEKSNHRAVEVANNLLFNEH